MDFPSLAAHAAAGDGSNVPPHARPTEGGGHQASCSLNTRVMNFMDRTNDSRTERGWYERSEQTGGNVAQEMNRQAYK